MTTRLHHDPPRATKSRRIRLNVTDDMYERLEAVAEMADVSVAHVCRQAFRDFLSGYPKSITDREERTK